MFKYLLISLCMITACGMRAQSLYFPPLTGDTWETVDPEYLGWCMDRSDSLFDYLESCNTKAFIVLKDGKIAIEKYFGTFSQDSIWYWASAAKTLTAFMIGIAQQENYLSISDTSSKYLGTGWTDCTPEQEEKITVRNQLTMTTGLDDYVEDNHCTLDSCLIYKADAGTRWAYHNAPYTLLDSVIYYATGGTLNSYIYNKLTTKTGVSGLFFPVGYDNIFFSVPRSMARFGLLLQNKGNWNGVPVLSDTAYFHDMTNSSQELNRSYGYLCWLNGKESFMVPTLQYVFPGSLMPHAPDDMFSALGKNGQILNIVPSQELVVVRMGNSSGEDEVTLQFNDTIWQKLNAVLCVTDAVHEIKNSNISIYPNPASDILHVRMQDAYYDIEVFTIAGESILRKKYCFSETTLDLQHMTSGIYLLKIISDDGRQVYRKFMIE